jgi:spore coat protein A, manganese oxidase
MTTEKSTIRPLAPKLTRRTAIQGLVAAALPWSFGRQADAAVAGNNNVASWAISSDANIYAQAFARRFTNVFVNALDVTAFGGVGAIYRPDGGTGTVYTVAAAQAQQAILGIPGITTTIWGYRNYETGPTFPGRTFEVRQGTAITVNWRNDLTGANGPLPHLFPVDQTITIQTPTTGVPLAIHHHGGDTAFEFDGTPNQWQTPSRKEIGPGIRGDNSLGQLSSTTPGVRYTYPNTQEASLHWYHDHAEALTRTNVGAGLAGLYVLRDANEDSLLAAGRIPARAYEIAMVLQDRTFDASGNLTYTANPVDYPGAISPTFPRNNPTHMPEKFGDVICVNGLAWPKMNVEPRCYRLRILNGSDSRFYTLNFGAQTGVYQIGTDLGLLNRGVKLTTVSIAPGERLDLVVDFTAYAGKPVTTTQWVWVPLILGLGYWRLVTTTTPNQPTVNVDVTNSAATPFPGGAAPTGGATQVMRFAVSIPKSAAPDISAIALPLVNLRPKLTALPAAPVVPPLVRRILLAEGVDEYGRITPLLGVYDPTGVNNLGTLSMHDPVTEKPKLGTTEVWEFWNASVDAHPVHMHLVQFRVLNRQAFAGTAAATVMSNGWEGVKLQPGATLTGAAAAAPATEQGWKDTVICPPGQVTRVVAQFNKAGNYVYHCHILSHEEHDMMRYYEVVDPAAQQPTGLVAGIYTLQSVNSGQMLNVYGALTAAGTTVIQWPSTPGAKNEQWQVTPVGGGQYTLTAMHSGQLLDVNGGLTADGTKVQQWPANGGSNQKWLIEDLGDGSFRVVNVMTGKVLDVAGVSTVAGATVYQWTWWGGANQRWIFTKV